MSAGTKPPFPLPVKSSRIWEWTVDLNTHFPETANRAPLKSEFRLLLS